MMNILGLSSLTVLVGLSMAAAGADMPKSPFFTTTTQPPIYFWENDTGHEIVIHADGTVICPGPMTEEEAQSTAEQSTPYGAIYLAIWRAYCPVKPLSTFAKPEDHPHGR